MHDARCFDLDTLLLYRSAALPPDLSADVVAHVTTCVHCQATLATLVPLTPAKVRERYWGRIDRYLNRARAAWTPTLPVTPVMHVSWSDLLDRLRTLFIPAGLVPVTARGDTTPVSSVDLAAKRELVLFEGVISGVQPPLLYALRLIVEPQAPKHEKRRRFECQLSDQLGQPVVGRKVRLTLGSGLRPHEGRLGVGLASTDEAGVARYSVWLGGKWLETTLDLLAAGAAPPDLPLPPGDEFRVDLLNEEI